jgi:tRNA-splicing ligase RtcB
MTERELAPVTRWLIEPLSPQVAASIDRLRGADDVQQVAVMPDVHLAADVCVGAVVATRRLIYPQAVGGDIGCGMAALAFDLEVDAIDDEHSAAQILSGLYRAVPCNKHRALRTLPAAASAHLLSSDYLAKVARRDGAVQLGTLGRGNHFLELQADSDGRLWAMVHSGSRAIGQAITSYHLKQGEIGSTGLVALDSTNDRGRAYLTDANWARQYASSNRLAMLTVLADLLAELFGATADWSTLVQADHNQVVAAAGADGDSLVHRKGAQSARLHEPGLIPGSMGTASFLIEGRGCEAALHSCSHGAGRRLSRGDARDEIDVRTFARQTSNVWFDHRLSARLREEAPTAYKDIRRVMRAQRELAKSVVELRSVLTYKGV